MEYVSRTGDATMSECDEVAATLLTMWRAYRFMFRSMDSLKGCRFFVEEQMPGETQQIWDNVAEALYRMGNEA